VEGSSELNGAIYYGFVSKTQRKATIKIGEKKIRKGTSRSPYITLRANETLLKV
jgi:hypothetical protein